MLSVEALWSRIAPFCAPRATERTPRRSALDRSLARGLRATGDLPPADVSALDGYAYAGDIAAGTELAVTGTLAAGAPPGAILAAGSALRIWTGAPLPEGADRVVAVERTESPTEGVVRVLEPPPAGHAIRRRGEITAAGEELLPAGARLNSAALALAASQGIDGFDTRRAPRVAFLTTGDEVVPASERPAPGGLRDSHTDYLLAAGRRIGLELEALGLARDDPDQLRRMLEPALGRVDVVVTCGGVSMGGADHLPGVLERLGCETLAHGVAMQPGKPLLFATRGETLVFGLPGNPASVMVGFRLFVRPALERMLGAGAAGFWADAIELATDAPLRAGEGRDRFLPARSVASAGGLRAQPLEARGSHDLAAFARADLLLRVRAEEPERAAGARVTAILWN